MPPDGGSAVYGEYLKDELARQDARKASFEQRGIAVVTTAGTLVTLLLGFSALTSKAAKERLLHGDTAGWLAASLVLFVVASVVALVTNFPTGYRSLRADEMRERVDMEPEDGGDTAAYVVADLRLNILATAQEKNSSKGGVLFIALACEVLAVLCLGVAVFKVVVHAPPQTHPSPPPVVQHGHGGHGRD